MSECKACKYNKEGSKYSHRICLACTGDAQEAYEKVFNPSQDRRPWQD